MNMNLPVLTSMVKKPRAKIKPSPIFSLSWVNFRLFKMGKGNMNTEERCQKRTLAAFLPLDSAPTQKLANDVHRPGHLLQMRIGKGRALERVEPASVNSLLTWYSLPSPHTLHLPIDRDVLAAPKQVGKDSRQTRQYEIRRDASKKLPHPRLRHRHHRGIAHEQAELREVEPGVEAELGGEPNLPSLVSPRPVGNVGQLLHPNARLSLTLPRYCVTCLYSSNPSTLYIRVSHMMLPTVQTSAITRSTSEIHAWYCRREKRTQNRATRNTTATTKNTHSIACRDIMSINRQVCRRGNQVGLTTVSVGVSMVTSLRIGVSAYAGSRCSFTTRC